VVRTTGDTLPEVQENIKEAMLEDVLKVVGDVSKTQTNHI